MTAATWIFGYGSLIWKADFPFAERALAWIDGYGRRFWQASTDHRGVPGAPGRVVTLVREPGARCLGAAYRLREAERAEVLDHLDFRERGGYERAEIALEFAEAVRASASAIVYWATPDNPNYLGPAPAAAIAQQIRDARGPSGANPDYLFELAAFLRHNGADEPHVFEIESALRREAAATGTLATGEPGE